MLPSKTVFPLALAMALAALGCGPSTPEHVERPLTERPAPAANAFDKLKTPEEKIKYIESSNAPESEKKQAIAMIKSGKL